MPKLAQTCSHSPESKQFGTEAQALPPWTLPRSWMLKASNVSNKLWGVFYIMHGLSQLLWIKWKQLSKWWLNPHYYWITSCIMRMQKFDSMCRTWYKINTPLHRTCWKQSSKLRVWAFFHGMEAKNGELICFIGAIHVSLTIMGFDVLSAAEAKLGTLYHNCQTGIIFWLTLAEMGHLQPKTPVHCNNATAVGITNNSIKRRCSFSMEMQFF
jgi:hypothetical protein